MLDPTAVFSMLFVSELFEEYLGQLAMDSSEMFSEGEEVDPRKLQEKLKVFSNIFGNMLFAMLIYFGDLLF